MYYGKTKKRNGVTDMNPLRLSFLFVFRVNVATSVIQYLNGRNVSLRKVFNPYLLTAQ